MLADLQILTFSNALSSNPDILSLISFCVYLHI